MRVAVAISLSVISLTLPSAAFAQEPTVDHPPPPVASENEPASPPVADRPAGEPPKHDEAEDRWHASVDAVFGFGATPTVSQRIVGPLLTNESRSLQSARYTTTSINLGLSYELLKDFRVGLLLPVGAGSLYPNETRGATVVGNLTLGGEYEMRIRKDLHVNAGLEVALPTASGDELPEEGSLRTSGHLNQTSLDRFSLLRAMSDSRGREDTASFSSNHLGLVPRVGVISMGEKLELEGYVKYESLHATADTAAYEGAVVVLARGSYHITKTVDGTLRVWTNIPVAGPDSAVAAAEPQLSVRLGWVTPMIGVVLPFAGDLTSPYAIGVRGVLAARF